MSHAPKTFNFSLPQAQIPSPGESLPGFLVLGDIASVDLDLAGVSEFNGPTPNMVEVGMANTAVGIPFATAAEATAFFAAIKAAVENEFGSDSVFSYIRDDGRSRFLSLNNSASSIGVFFIQDTADLLPSPSPFNVNFGAGQPWLSDHKSFVTKAEALAFLASLQQAVENNRGH